MTVVGGADYFSAEVAEGTGARKSGDANSESEHAGEAEGSVRKSAYIRGGGDAKEAVRVGISKRENTTRFCSRGLLKHRVIFNLVLREHEAVSEFAWKLAPGLSIGFPERFSRGRKCGESGVVDSVSLLSRSSMLGRLVFVEGGADYVVSRLKVAPEGWQTLGGVGLGKEGVDVASSSTYAGKASRMEFGGGFDETQTCEAKRQSHLFVGQAVAVQVRGKMEFAFDEIKGVAVESIAKGSHDRVRNRGAEMVEFAARREANDREGHLRGEGGGAK